MKNFIASYHQVFVYCLVSYAVIALVIGSIEGIDWRLHSVLSFTILAAFFAGVGELYNFISRVGR